MADLEIDVESSGSEDAARDVMSAIKRGDAAALDKALQLHYESCESSDSSDDDEDEETPKSTKRY